MAEEVDRGLRMRTRSFVCEWHKRCCPVGDNFGRARTDISKQTNDAPILELRVAVLAVRTAISTAAAAAVYTPTTAEEDLSARRS